MNVDQAKQVIGPLKYGDLIELQDQGIYRVGHVDMLAPTTRGGIENDARYSSVELYSGSFRTCMSYQLIAWALGAGGARRINQPLSTQH